MHASSANIPKSTAPPQGARLLQIRRVVGSAPSGSTARLNLGADLAAVPAFFMANPRLAMSAGGGFLGAIRAKSPSVISVTYGVVLRFPESIYFQCINHVDSSERCESGFRKVRILVPKGANVGSGKHERLWFLMVRMSAVPDSANLGS